MLQGRELINASNEEQRTAQPSTFALLMTPTTALMLFAFMRLNRMRSPEKSSSKATFAFLLGYLTLSVMRSPVANELAVAASTSEPIRICSRPGVWSSSIRAGFTA
jgi:hypothetical protein